MGHRASILINCSQAESDLIHERARIERRSISGYVLNVVLGYVGFEENVLAKSHAAHRGISLSPWKRPVQVAGPRTTFLVRCSREESERIRAAARRRDLTTSGYVLSDLRRTWKVQTDIGKMLIPPKLLADR